MLKFVTVDFGLHLLFPQQEILIIQLLRDVVREGNGILQ